LSFALVEPKQQRINSCKKKHHTAAITDDLKSDRKNNNMDTSRLRFGIIGTANIARAFAAGVSSSKQIQIVAVASRELAKARQFAEEFQIGKSFGSYEELLADPLIDAIYLPLPNSMHAEWAIRSAQAGKHIFCEKPLATSLAEARSMFAAAEEHSVVLREAYPYLAQPQTVKTRDLIDEGAIGRLQLIRASFGVPFSDRDNIRLNPSLGGGALLDAGSYPVSLVRILAKQRPKRVQATAKWDDNALDRTLAATIDFEGDLLAQISCSFATGFHRHALIAGDEGIIETDYTNHAWSSGPPLIRLRRGLGFRTPYEVIETPGGDGFLAEADSFNSLINEGESVWSGATKDESLDIAATLDAIAQSARSDGQWINLGAGQPE
jgi:D-xylose 1-dehydrogenase (NADP+, D-xylono-1,5-lactone-forming)